MKGGDRTKVVLRHLPHNISQSALIDQIDARFASRYRWFSFLSGKNSLKCQSYSRAYIDFKQPEDVIEFADFFDGHVFVNEKGTQFKTIVEYAPSQRVPKQWSKKDGREGTIDKDPQYLEFLELLAKPVENLPSAEVQLERKEAERAGAAKEAPIVTPLMDFIRQKRAAKGASRRALANGKSARRTSGGPSSSTTSAAVKRGSERRTSTTMYVPRDTGKSRSGKEKSTYVQIQNRDGQQLSEKPAGSSSVSGSVVLEGSADTGKKKILLLKGKEKEIPNINLSSPVKLLHGSGGTKQNQQQEGRVIRSILVNKQNQSEQQNQPPNMERRLPPRSSNGLPDDNTNDKRSTRNKDRPERGVWTPLKRPDEPLSSSSSQSTQVPLESAEGTHGEVKNDLSIARSGRRGGYFSVDNDKYVGSYKHGNRPGGPSYNVKDADGSSNISEGKPLKRGVSGSHEKQVWVQKSSSGS
ncbi:regulator of nonsense transcripts UPF3-like isoform X2 [Bidens hawaiensis]|uniref:regulator of nonsense transcripts UPF3-like isoform X2 n=1 Tax=Bidens hawaiensis TaxID=980011 RepID=UPI0040497AA3